VEKDEKKSEPKNIIRDLFDPKPIKDILFPSSAKKASNTVLDIILRRR